MLKTLSANLSAVLAQLGDSHPCTVTARAAFDERKRELEAAKTPAQWVSDSTPSSLQPALVRGCREECE